MLTSILAVLSFKMVAYTVLLLVLTARMFVWKKRYIEAHAALDAEKFERDELKNTLLEVGKQTSLWQTIANSQAIKVLAAQEEAARIKADYDAKVQAILQLPISNDSAFDFLREQALQ